MKSLIVVIVVLILTPNLAFSVESTAKTSETVFFLSDDLKSAVKYFNNRGALLPEYSFLFSQNFKNNDVMYARPANYRWGTDSYNGNEYKALQFPDTNNYAYMQKFSTVDGFLTTSDSHHYKLSIDGSTCIGNNCVQDENIIVAVLPQKFRVNKYDSTVQGTWKVVGNTYTFYSKKIKGASIQIDFEDTIPYVYAELAKVLSKFSDIKVSYDGTNVLVAMPVEGVFNSGDAAIQKNGEKWLAIFTDALKKSKFIELRVEGHSDNIPIRSKIYPSNWELSAARAATVVRYLASLGLDPKSLAAVGYADSRPITDNKNPESRKKNRRIEFTIVPMKIANPDG